MFTTIYENHHGLALNKHILDRADMLLNWQDLIRIEKTCKLILRTSRIKQYVQILHEDGG